VLDRGYGFEPWISGAHTLNPVQPPSTYEIFNFLT
jgi:hypothetical protein